MGGRLTHLRWGGDPDVPHPVSGLTRRDIHAVQKSWTPVFANHVVTGTELLKRLFRAHPETKQLFKMLKNLPEEEYINNFQFKAHVINLMTSLNLAVSHLHEPEVVVSMMEKIGESHNRRKLTEQHFHDLKQVIVSMFIEVLAMDEKTIQSWGKTVEFWYKHLFTMLDKKEQQAF